jgi:HEAT repeat protein
MTEAELRAHFEPEPQTFEDASDRECRWTWDDGALTVLLLRGKLERASWLATGAEEAELLVDPGDRLERLLSALKGGQPPDRYRALIEIRKLQDWRAADGVLQLLRLESDFVNRSQAALILAELGDERASDLLLNDLRARTIPDAILEAIGKIGNERAVDELIQAERRVGSVHTKAKIRSAIAQIESRLPPE